MWGEGGDDSFSFFKGQVKFPVLHNTRDGSEFYVPYLSHLYIILGGGLRLWVGWEEGKEESQGGFIPVYYEACLKTQPAHKPLITRFLSSKKVVFVFSINHLTVGSFSINSFNSRLQKYSITTIHHDEKHDFFFNLVQCLSA